MSTANANIWQRRAARVLVEMLDAAVTRGLPGALWKVSGIGVLVGTFSDPDMAKRRAGFLAWAQFLGITDWRSSETNGVTHLWGRARQADGPGWRRCQIVLNADLYDNACGGDPQ